MSNNGAGELVGPGGVPLRRRVAVLKVPKSMQMNPQAMRSITAMLKCDLILLPMECELMMGELARKEVEAIHAAIHALLGKEAEVGLGTSPLL